MSGSAYNPLSPARSVVAYARLRLHFPVLSKEEEVRRRNSSPIESQTGNLPRRGHGEETEHSREILEDEGAGVEHIELRKTSSGRGGLREKRIEFISHRKARVEHHVRKTPE